MDDKKFQFIYKSIAFASIHCKSPKKTAMASESFTRILMFSFPQEFVSMSRKLLDDRELQERLVRNGKNYITTCHNTMKERITYQKLVETLH